MNSYSDGKSGADKAFIEIFKRIKNINVTVVTSKLGKQLCEKEKMPSNYIITTKETEFNHVRLIYFRRIIQAVLLILNVGRFDIIYSTSDALADVLPAFIFKVRNGLKPVVTKVVWVQKIFHLIPKERKLSHLAQEISFTISKRFADVIIVDNKLLKEELIIQDFPNNKIKVNHLGVDHEFFRKIPAANKKVDATFLGRLHESKGIFDLIKIWKIVTEKIPYAKLVIVGQGSKKTVEKLREHIETSKMQNNITLAGYLEDKAAFSLIKSSKVFLFPSYEEGFGMIIAEVMALGIPIAAYDLPVYKDTFKSAMKTVPVGRTDLFADAVLELLSDPKMRRTLTNKANDVIKRFAWELTVKKEEELMNKKLALI